jgi:hypothetical protein
MIYNNNLLGPVCVGGGINTKLYLPLLNDVLEQNMDEMPLTV